MNKLADGSRLTTCRDDVFFTAWRRRLIIAVLALTAYYPTLKMGFLWDDHVMIEQNQRLHAWSSDNLRHDFHADVFDGHGDRYYRPMQTIANRVDYTLWKLRPFGYHLTNLLFHIGNSLLAGELLIALGALPIEALIAGVFFAVHPIGVEQMMIIAGRAELMALFFSLAAILFLLQRGAWPLAASTISFILALLSKESAVATPFLAALAFYKRRTVPSSRQVVSRDPSIKASMDGPRITDFLGDVFKVLGFSSMVFPYLLWRRHVMGPIPFSVPHSWIPLFYFKAFPKVLWEYAGLIFAPWNLHSHRLMPHLSHYWFLYLSAWIALKLALWLAGSRFGLFCLGWFVVTFLPKTPVMIAGNFMLDHWAYPAVIPAGWVFAKIIARLWNTGREWRRATAVILCMTVIINLALLVRLNVELRNTDEKMYRWALRFTTSNPIKYNLGAVLLNQNKPEEALGYFLDVHRAYPDDLHNSNAIAQAIWQIGQKIQAIDYLEALHRKHPEDSETSRHLEQLKLKLQQRE
jgi:hypothetical protein